MRGGTCTPSLAIVEISDASCSGEIPISWPMEIAPMETLDQRSTGFAQPRVNSAHGARLRQNVSHREHAMRLAVTNAHAIDDNRSHLAIKHFVRPRDFFFQSGRNGHH